MAHSILVSENAGGLLSLMKQETDPDMRREMLQMLMVTGSEDSDEYLFELLENEK